MTAHHYTSTVVETAAAAVNAGTCLEDANEEDNVFSHIGEAVEQVCECVCVCVCVCACARACVCVCVPLHQHVIEMPVLIMLEQSRS